MLKILQVRLQQCERPDVQPDFRKGRGTRDQTANIEKAREFQKNIYFSLTTLKSLAVWIITNHGKFLEMGIPDHLPVS